MVPRPGSRAVARRTREHRGPGRGHEGTVDTPAPNQNHQKIVIFIGPSPPPLRLTRLREQGLPPLLRPLLTHPPLLLRLRRAFLMIPQTPTHATKLQQGDLGIPSPQMRRIRPTRPAPNHTTKLNPLRKPPSHVGEAVEGATEHDLERSCHFPIIFFMPPQKFQITSTRLQDVPYSLTFSCPLHTS